LLGATRDRHASIFSSFADFNGSEAIGYFVIRVPIRAYVLTKGIYKIAITIFQLPHAIVQNQAKERCIRIDCHPNTIYKTLWLVLLDGALQIKYYKEGKRKL